MRIAKSVPWGAVTITVSVDDPSKIARPEQYAAIRKAVDKLAGLLRDAFDDDALMSPDDEVLDIVRPKDGRS